MKPKDHSGKTSIDGREDSKPAIDKVTISSQAATMLHKHSTTQQTVKIAQIDQISKK